jgi:hypothetical protein
MSFAQRQHGGVYRRLHLRDEPQYQTHRRIEDLKGVPPLSDTAVVADVTIHTIRYDDGVHTWFVDRNDKRLIRAYRRYRKQEDIDDGAFPVAVYFDDGRGSL